MPKQFAIDEAIRQEYDAVLESVDEILTEQSVRDSFVMAVNLRVVDATENEALKRLITLRKRGASSGGLPRRAK